jgi:hypothetical protein
MMEKHSKIARMVKDMLKNNSNNHSDSLGTFNAIDE